MKLALVTLVAVLSVAMAAPPMPSMPPVSPMNDYKCVVKPMMAKPSWVKLAACCRSNMGKSKLDKNGKKAEMECRLPWKKVMGFKKCVNDLNYSAMIDCERD
ncbi:unnamed protein product [Mortierella alpina]